MPWQWVNKSNPRRDSMKKEDLTMIILVAFSILWTAAFGWGFFG